MNTILKAGSKSCSGKTYYYGIAIPENVLTIKAGTFCGCAGTPEAAIKDIAWVYNFGKKYFSITINGKYQLKDYVELIKKYYHEPK